MLTLQLKRCSETSIVTGDERGFVVSANSTGKGTTNIWRLRAFQLDSFFLEVLGVEAELRAHTADLRVSSIAGERTWPELGFRACERIHEREGMRWI
jgi:hypothetical protein